MEIEPDLKCNPDYGPYLVAALFCEKVLQEKDGVNSAIRIIDRVTRTLITDDPPKTMEPFPTQFAFLLILKTGENSGLTEIELIPCNPDNKRFPALRRTVNLDPPSYKGVNLVVNVAITFDKPGPWWFEVKINNQLRTKVPLEVVYLPQINPQIHAQG